MGRGRDQDLAAEMAAFLLRSQLVFEVNASGAGLDEDLHDLEGVERPAETGFGIGDDRREPGVDRKPLALCGFDMVGALQRAVDALGQFRTEERSGGKERVSTCRSRWEAMSEK